MNVTYAEPNVSAEGKRIDVLADGLASKLALFRPAEMRGSEAWLVLVGTQPKVGPLSIDKARYEAQRLLSNPEEYAADLLAAEVMEKIVEPKLAETDQASEDGDPDHPGEEKGEVVTEPLIEANNQMLLFPASEGVPDDYEDDRRRRIKGAREDAEYKKMRADANKKQAALTAKICDREAHYAQVLDVIDEARCESMKRPGKIMVAVDTSNDPEVLELGEWKAMPAHKREQFALYAIWEGGVERTWDEVKDLVDVMPEPKEDAEADSSEDTEQDSDFEEDEISGAEDPIEELSELAENIDAGEYSDPKDTEKTEEGVNCSPSSRQVK